VKRFSGDNEGQQNYLNYNMLVFKEEQSGSVFRILLYIEDIVPSRVKTY